MSKTTKRNISIAVAAGVLALLSFKLLLNKNTVESKMYRHDARENILVSAEKIGYGKINTETVYTGILEPMREVKILSETQGKVVSVDVEEGDWITAGQTIAKVDDAVFRLQYEAIEVQLDGLLKDVNRYKKLVQAEAIQAIQLEKTENMYKTADVQKRTIEEQISRATVRAPFSGVVTMKMFELGAFLNPGIPLIQLTDMTWLKLIISVSEDRILTLKKGQRVTVETDVYPGKNFIGTIVMVGSKGDVSHNYTVHILLKNTTESPLKAGMFGSVTIRNQTNGHALMVPVNAVIGSHANAKVYRVKNNTANLQDITVGGASATYIEVLTGLQEGDLVITGGHINLFDGAHVALAK